MLQQLQKCKVCILASHSISSDWTPVFALGSGLKDMPTPGIIPLCMVATSHHVWQVATLAELATRMLKYKYVRLHKTAGPTTLCWWVLGGPIRDHFIYVIFVDAIVHYATITHPPFDNLTLFPLAQSFSLLSGPWTWLGFMPNVFRCIQRPFWKRNLEFALSYTTGK